MIRGLGPRVCLLLGQPTLDHGQAARPDGGVVRLTASEVIGCEILPPILADFQAKHPQIEIELILSNQLADLTRRDADIAIRMARPTQNTLVARKIGLMRLNLYAAPEYVARRGRPCSVEEIDDHVIIGFDSDTPKIQGRVDLGRPITRDMFSIRTDSQVGQLAAVRAGLGIGACHSGLAERYGLQPVLPDRFCIEMEMWLCMLEGLRTTRRMRLMFDHLAKGLAAYVDPRGSTAALSGHQTP